MYASIYPTMCRRRFFFLVTLFHGDIILLYLHAYLEYDFMMANLVTLNLAVLKILKTSQEYTLVECHVSKVTDRNSFHNLTNSTPDVAII